ncbi:MAG: methionine--tRNA ligase subunit beta, partial [Clostridia bacterium]|nr:methionine--tRNA ligase subunit beta [Clostridia bacterium]
LGNLVNRTIAMNNKYFGGVIQSGDVKGEFDDELKEIALAMPAKVKAKMDELKVADAIDEIFVLLRRANKYIDETTPWILAKNPETMPRLGTVLYNLLEAIRFAAIALEPYLPDTSKRILEQLNIGNGGLESLQAFGGMVAGEKVGTPEILFARLDPVKKMEEINAANEVKQGKAEKKAEKQEKKAEKKEEKQQKKEEKKHEEPTYPESIDIDTFFQSKIQVGRVLECTNVPKSKKLLQFRLSFGKDGERTILSGIAQYYPDPAALVGKQIVAITNLAPRKMMGIESHGMILSAVDDEGNLRLASVGEGVADGALIG